MEAEPRKVARRGSQAAEAAVRDDADGLPLAAAGQRPEVGVLQGPERTDEVASRGHALSRIYQELEERGVSLERPSQLLEAALRRADGLQGRPADCPVVPVAAKSVRSDAVNVPRLLLDRPLPRSSETSSQHLHSTSDVCSSTTLELLHELHLFSWAIEHCTTAIFTHRACTAICLFPVLIHALIPLSTFLASHTGSLDRQLI